MTVAVYTTNPSPASNRFHASGVTILQPGNDDRSHLPNESSQGPFGSIGFIGKGDVRRGSMIRMDLGDALGVNIPAGALITDAFLDLTPSAVNTNPVTNIHVALARKDGRWDVLGGPAGAFFGQQAFDSACEVNVQDDGFVTRWSTGITAGPSAWPLFDLISPVLPQAQSFGQRMTESAPASFTLGRVQIRMYASGTATGDVWLEVWEVVGGLIDESGPIATSATRTHASIGASPASLEDFDFSAPDDILISANDDLALMVRTDIPGDATGNIRVSYQEGHSYANGEAIGGGHLDGFGSNNYIQTGNLAGLQLYDTDHETILNSPVGGDSLIAVIDDFPNFVTVGVPVEVRPDGAHPVTGEVVPLKHLIQAWVSGADPGGYVEGDPLGLIFQPHSDSNGVNSRNWFGTELTVHFRPRGAHVG